MKTVKITGKGQIAIPRDIRKHKGFEEGSKICIIVYGDRIELRPIEQVDEKLSTALASEKVLSRDWDSKEEEEAWKDL